MGAQVRGAGVPGLGGVSRGDIQPLPLPHLQKRMQQIMAHCFQAVKSKLQCRLGYFDLIGCDFLIDENFKVLLGFPRVSGAWWAGGRKQGPSVYTLTTQASPGVESTVRLPHPPTPTPAKLLKGSRPSDPQTIRLLAPWPNRSEATEKK